MRPQLIGLALVVTMSVAASAVAGERWIPLGPGAVGSEPEVQLISARPEGVIVEIGFGGVVAEEVDTERGRFTRISAPGCGVTTDLGAPLLPVLREHVEIPQGAEPALSIVEIQEESLALSELGVDHRLFPAQPPVPKIPGARESMPFVFDEAAYSAAGPYPAQAVRLGGEGQIRAHRFVELEVVPLRYDPVAGAARVLSRVVVEVSFEGADWPATQRQLDRLASRDFEQMASRLLLGSEAFQPRSKAGGQPAVLIVSPDSYLDAVAELAALRHSLGFPVNVASTADIPSGATAEGIKAFIESKYASDAPPTFVVLVGDTDRLPCFEVGGGWYSTATDLGYSTMDGPSDWLPDLLVGRLPGDSAEEIAALVEKTVDYTEFALNSGVDWVTRATFMASVDNNHISEGTHDYVIDGWLDDAGFTSQRRYCVANNATTEQCLADFNAGLSQITFSGHGYSDGWADGPEVDSGHVMSLTNVEMWPVVQSYACDTGAYMEDDSYAEVWVNAPNGAVQFFGSSISSLWDEDDILERAAYDAWFGEGYTWLRAALLEGLFAVYDAYSGGGQSESYFHQYNLFGDPALEPWTGTPMPLEVGHDTAIPEGAPELVAVVTDGESPVTGAFVVVSDPETHYAVGETDGDGEVELTIDPVPAVGTVLTVRASARNHIPYLGEAEVVAGSGGGGDDDDGPTGRPDGGSYLGDGDGELPYNPPNSGCGCRVPATSARPAGLLGLLLDLIG